MKHVYIIAAILFALNIGATSCRKAEKEQGVQFAAVTFMDLAGVGSNLELHYQGWKVDNWASGTVAVFPGEAAFSLIDKTTRVTVLDTVLKVDLSRPKTYYLFQPDSTTPMQLMQNTQAEELPVRDGYIKVRLGNYAKIALPGSNIKVVFNQLDWNTYEYVPLDTLANVITGIPESYAEIKRGTMLDEAGNPVIDIMYSLTFLDENDQPILNSAAMPVSVEFLAANSVYTMYLAEDAGAGGDPFVFISMVFEN